MFQDKSVDEWISLLENEDIKSRKIAALALGEIEETSPRFSDVMNRLVEVLNNDPDDGVMVNCGVSLVKLGAPAKVLKPLIDYKRKQLESIKLEDKLGSIESLKKIGTSGELGKKLTFNLMVDALKDDEWIIRYNALAFLNQVIDEKAIKPLIIALDDENVDVQSNAARALKMIFETKRPEEIPDKDRNLAVKELIKKIEDPNIDWTVKCFSIQALGGIRNVLGVDRIIEILEKDENENVRMYAAHTLGDLKLKKAIKPLLYLFKNDSHPNVRKNAEEALMKIFDTIDDNDPEKQAFLKLEKMFIK
ncbi:MAG: HEAT repeat domain-containing protein [Candidatus Lokiarchaeota archaeon]|nr:HEAT repeat domain-containing protein [Candidatus Lokiarchaeota archaeon]